MNRVLIVFAKEPIKGTVKTRLNGRFSEKDLTRLYKEFVKDTLVTARKVKNINKILAFSSKKAPRFLKRVSSGFEMIEQIGRSLGNRMHNAFVYAQKHKSKKTVIIGTDSPTLPASVIKKAFKALTHRDIVIGPSIDGGYYLIGMKESCAHIFRGVKWGSHLVFKKTIDNAKSLGKTIFILDEWYDVDDEKGWRNLTDSINLTKDKNNAKHTRKLLKNFSCYVSRNT